MKTNKKRLERDQQRPPRRHRNVCSQCDYGLHDLPRAIPDELAETVADRLKRSLRYAGISQNEMAAYLGMHRNAIGGYVTGKHRIKPALLRLWAAEVGIPVEWITTGNWPKADA